MSFRFEHASNFGDRVNVSIPTDDEGYLGRECPEPECEGYFKVKPGTGLTGPDLLCTCPYCGYRGPADRFWTKAQIEYAKSVVLRDFAAAVRKDLRQLEFEHKPKGPFGVGISLKVKDGPPLPLRHYREETLETKVTCDQCTLEYSVFGVFGYCSDCAVHNSLQILQKNLDLTRKQVDLALSVDDPDLQQHLLDDALENCVSAFDAFGREACRIRSSKSSDPQRCQRISFQNLDRVSDALADLFGIDFAGLRPTEEWKRARRGFMRRHVLAHRAGVVDQQYLDESGDDPSLLGRRLLVSSEEVQSLGDLVATLASSLVAELPDPL